MADDFSLYQYHGELVKVLDGDTIRTRLQLGLTVAVTVDLRLLGINAPEVVGEQRAAGLAAAHWLTDLLAGRTLYVKTFKDRRSFTRYLAHVWYEDDEGQLMSVAAALIDAGHAQPATYAQAAK